MATPLLPGDADHRAAELAAERRAAERQRAADRLRRHRPRPSAVPCQRGRRTGRSAEPGQTVLLSTVPKQAPKAVDRGLLIERVNNDLLVIVRNTPVVSAPLNQVLSPACRAADVHRTRRQGHRRIRRAGARVPTPTTPASRCAANAAATTSARRSSASSPTCPGPRPPGLEFSATIDSRYSTSPTLLKLLAMIVGVAMTVDRARRAARARHRRRRCGTAASCRRAGGR